MLIRNRPRWAQCWRTYIGGSGAGDILGQVTLSNLWVVSIIHLTAHLELSHCMLLQDYLLKKIHRTWLGDLSLSSSWCGLLLSDLIIIVAIILFGLLYLDLDPVVRRLRCINYSLLNWLSRLALPFFTDDWGRGSYLMAVIWLVFLLLTVIWGGQTNLNGRSSLLLTTMGRLEEDTIRHGHTTLGLHFFFLIMLINMRRVELRCLH